MRADLEQKLPALVEGKVRPKDNDERREYVIMCSIKKLYVTSTRLSVDLLAADPRLAADLASKFRYNSAICAALASTGNSEDAASLDDRERARLRKLAIDWLRADLVLHERKLKSGRAEDRTAVESALREWQEVKDLACIRDPATLAVLPAEDREAFERLWADVAALLGE